MKILNPKPQDEAAKKSATPITPAYRVNDLFMSTFAGSFQQIGIMLFELCGLSLSIGAYRWVWENYRLFDIDAKENVMLCYVCLMLGKDFGCVPLYACTCCREHVPMACGVADTTGTTERCMSSTSCGLRILCTTPVRTTTSPPVCDRESSSRSGRRRSTVGWHSSGSRLRPSRPTRS